MTSSLIVRTALIVGLGTAVAGCGCNQQYNFQPQQPAVLGADHGQWLSMDVAPDGRLVVTYYDRDTQGLGFAKGTPRDDGTVAWDYEEVDGYPDNNGLNPGDRGTFTSVEVAPDGRVWASYRDATVGALRAGVRTGSVWEVEVVDPGSGLSPDVGEWTSMELDSDGNPVVAHFDKAEGALRISRYDGSAWASESAFEGSDVGERSAAAGMMADLLIDESTEYVAFYDGAAQSLNLIEGFPGAYSHTVVDTDGNVGAWPSIAQHGDELLIAYQAVDTQNLMLARRTGAGGFTTEVVDDGEYMGADTEVFVRDGQVNILYFDGHENDMRLAVQTDSGWDLQTLAGTDKAVGYHNEVAFTHGRWWAASYDYTNRQIFVQAL